MGKKNRKPTKPTPSAAAPVPAVRPAVVVPPALAEAPHAFFRLKDWIAAAVTFVISGAVFLYCMSPEVTLQDSGELVTGAFNFGVPHLTGYPL